VTELIGFKHWLKTSKRALTLAATYLQHIRIGALKFQSMIHSLRKFGVYDSRRKPRLRLLFAVMIREKLKRISKYAPPAQSELSPRVVSDTVFP
jgi:hypothetical protein